MPRYRITLEYDGQPFCGWQAQANGPSVQTAVEAALARLTGEFARAVRRRAHRCRRARHRAGRPFRSVEAVGRQGPARRAERPSAPAPVAVLEAAETAPDFHARFSATGRRYLYRIVNRHVPLALERDRAWWVRRPLDATAMHDAAQRLVGHHDFTTFRSSTASRRPRSRRWTIWR
jgi:tRNA pseudouridine38-40 synthase